MENIIALSWADGISLGRQLICDPDYPNKLFDRNQEPIRHCIACNQGCFDSVREGRPVFCSLNPEFFCTDVPANTGVQRVSAGREKTVMIVGAGPAGMHAAIRAAKAGARVWLFDRRGYFGHNVMLASRLPEKSGFLAVRDDLVQEVFRHENIDIRLDFEVDPQVILDHRPDVVVLAFGAQHNVPDNLLFMDEFVLVGENPYPAVNALADYWCPHCALEYLDSVHPDVMRSEAPTRGEFRHFVSRFGRKYPRIHLHTSILSGNCRAGSDNIVVGGGMAGIETALCLARDGVLSHEAIYFHLRSETMSPDELKNLAGSDRRRVVLVEETSRLGAELGKSTAWVALRQLRQNSIRTLTRSQVNTLHENKVTISSKHGDRELEADCVVLACGMRSAGTDFRSRLEVLYDITSSPLPKIFVAGNARSPGKFEQATADACRIDF